LSFLRKIQSSHLDSELTEKMVKAVGFLNLIVHEYGKIELKQVFEVAQKDIKDLNEYLKIIFEKLDLTE
jgi:uncharacterized protein YutE (UPF0331/DUF86 family)